MDLINNARELRHNQTDAEMLLWSKLRKRQLNGCKFRRQFPVHPYIVDFACLSERLIIELDGGQHAEQKAYDEKRTAYLESKGFRLLRYWNNEVLGQLQEVVDDIQNQLMIDSSTPPHPSPHPGGERE
ncbi:MAG: DUF559 domain-containing protein [Candidatus Sedimenticola sp. (ex Thyasira tokunagai)]